jgi:phenylacetate-coenzyme A ligase PaaK-like adenylate-forming protein
MAGHSMDPDRLIRTCQQLQPNVLAGAPSQLIQFARHVLKTRASIHFDKIIYTSEMLPVQQQTYLNQVFGGTRGPLLYGAIYGSAEAGPWAVANHTFTGHHAEFVDLIYDERAMIVEIVPAASETADQGRGNQLVETVPHGTAGIIVLTSLQKLRHPLVRYHTGDIGSLHDVTPEIRASVGDGAGNLRILRFYGRDRAESFKWQANFYEIRAVEEVMNTANWGVFDWQIVLCINKDTGEHTMEVKIIREEQSAAILTQSQLRSELSAFFNVYPKVDHLFHLRSVGLKDMVRSETAGKIIRLVDHTK